MCSEPKSTIYATCQGVNQIWDYETYFVGAAKEVAYTKVKVET